MLTEFLKLTYVNINIGSCLLLLKKNLSVNLASMSIQSLVNPIIEKNYSMDMLHSKFSIKNTQQ